MSIRLIGGDCREVLATLPANSVHCVVTSPPYYGLRAYLPDGHADKHREIGLEATPDAYLAEMVGVFREVKRVLRPDGTCWVNLGDLFVNKQLQMMPARTALALQADGWILRSDIIWAKPNPMPESVNSRPTSAHEHVFLLAKAARYFYDAAAIAEPAEMTPQRRLTENQTLRQPHYFQRGKLRDETALDNVTRACRNVWTIATAPLSSAFSGGSYRIASRDCAAHDRQADLAHVLECDARQGVFQFGRNPGKRSRPAELPEGAVVSIPVDRSAFPAGVTSAIGRSSQTHRTPALSERDVIFGDIPSGHTECRGLLDHSFAMFARTPASNTSADASPDGRLTCQSVESPDRIVGIATYEPRPAGCSCYYAGTVHQRQDHFASFPPALAERCIRAGTSERGCCAVCGAPWGRVTERSVSFIRGGKEINGGKHSGTVQALSGEYDIRMGPSVATTTTGWAPSCACGADTAPCTVLDPFAGAGTTLLVADRLQRDAIGVELNPAYTEMAMARCRDDAPLFAEPSPPPAEPIEEPRIRDLFA